MLTTLLQEEQAGSVGDQYPRYRYTPITAVTITALVTWATIDCLRAIARLSALWCLPGQWGGIYSQGEVVAQPYQRLRYLWSTPRRVEASQAIIISQGCHYITTF